ncbi:MAG: CCA tRNA nucleotidyltransferase [Pseudomonadota bacterium]
MTRLTSAWLFEDAPQTVMRALGDAFFVGGCVRNALMDIPVTDIDIATPLLPEEAQTRLKAAGIRTVPTGLQHGTQTAVVDGEGIEVTTFRRDIETDGRHAVVNFTDDIAVDAARRDFTMNALYATAEGELVDPLGGEPDLHDRRVRFIGQAEDRIREDYLRILRFFRFHALYGSDGIDADGLAACAELADGIDGLARERIGWEFRKLLAATDPAPATASMAAAGILMRCLPGADPTLLGPLVHVEHQTGRAPDWLTRLASLGGEAPAERLRLSKSEEQALRSIKAAVESSGPVDQIAYWHGADAAVAAAYLQAASTATVPSDDIGDIAQKGAAQVLPVAAKDLMQSGWLEGPALGDALKKAEQHWVDSGFALKKSDLIKLISAFAREP